MSLGTDLVLWKNDIFVEISINLPEPVVSLVAYFHLSISHSTIYYIQWIDA